MPLIDIDRVSAIVREVGQRVVLPRWRNLGERDVVEKSGPGDLVTVADKAAEEALTPALSALVAGSVVVGEEAVHADPTRRGLFDGDGPVWVIDPIDGTRSFICGLPVWGTLIGLMRSGEPAMGLMNQPYTGEMFIGDGGRAWLKGPRGRSDLQASQCKTLSDAYLMTTDPRLFRDGDSPAYARVESAVRLARYGTDCYAYAMLASGQVDLVIETGLKPYDIVALIPIIEGAGGVVTTWEGASAKDGGRIVAAATPELHEQALKLLRS